MIRTIIKLAVHIPNQIMTASAEVLKGDTSILECNASHSRFGKCATYSQVLLLSIDAIMVCGGRLFGLIPRPDRGQAEISMAMVVVSHFCENIKYRTGRLNW